MRAKVIGMTGLNATASSFIEVAIPNSLFDLSTSEYRGYVPTYILNLNVHPDKGECDTFDLPPPSRIWQWMAGWVHPREEEIKLLKESLERTQTSNL